MIYPSADKIDEEIDSKYALVVLAAKRARQIKEGGRPLIETHSTNPLTVALEEIAGGKIKYHFDESSLAGQEALADQRAVVGNRDLEIEGGDSLGLPDNLLAAAKELGADLNAVEILGGEDDESDEEAADEEEEEEPLLGTDDDTEAPIV